MKYKVWKEGGSLYLKCLNGGVGSHGQRLACSSDEHPVSVVWRLFRRGHTTTNPEEFALTGCIKSPLDVVTLAGFAKVLTDRPVIALYKRAA